MATDTNILTNATAPVNTTMPLCTNMSAIPHVPIDLTMSPPADIPSFNGGQEQYSLSGALAAPQAQQQPKPYIPKGPVLGRPSSAQTDALQVSIPSERQLRRQLDQQLAEQRPVQTEMPILNPENPTPTSASSAGSSAGRNGSLSFQNPTGKNIGDKRYINGYVYMWNGHEFVKSECQY